MRGIATSPGFRLGLIGLICGIVLTLSHLFTAVTIEDNKARFAAQTLASLLPNKLFTVRPLAADVYEIILDGSLIGHIFPVTTQAGYNGEIRLWLAVSTQGKVISARVIRHRETPGLGDRLELGISDWILDFNGASLDKRRFKVKKDGGDFDQFSGATITPRAVVRAIEQALILYPKQVISSAEVQG